MASVLKLMGHSWELQRLSLYRCGNIVTCVLIICIAKFNCFPKYCSCFHVTACHVDSNVPELLINVNLNFWSRNSIHISPIPTGFSVCYRYCEDTTLPIEGGNEYLSKDSDFYHFQWITGCILPGFSYHLICSWLSHEILFPPRLSKLLLWTMKVWQCRELPVTDHFWILATFTLQCMLIE